MFFALAVSFLACNPPKEKQMLQETAAYMKNLSPEVTAKHNRVSLIQEDYKTGPHDYLTDLWIKNKKPITSFLDTLKALKKFGEKSNASF